MKYCKCLAGISCARSIPCSLMLAHGSVYGNTQVKMVLWIFSLYDPQNWANTTYFQEIYAYQQICPTIWPHCSSTLRFFSEESISSATISFQSVDKHFYGSWLTVVEGHSSALATRSLFHRRKVSLSSSSAWRQWSMKRLMASLENKVCLNHLSGITFSSFVENERLSWPVLSLLWKKKNAFHSSYSTMILSYQH